MQICVCQTQIKLNMMWTPPTSPYSCWITRMWKGTLSSTIQNLFCSFWLSNFDLIYVAYLLDFFNVKSRSDNYFDDSIWT